MLPTQPYTPMKGHNAMELHRLCRHSWTKHVIPPFKGHNAMELHNRDLYIIHDGNIAKVTLATLSILEGIEKYAVFTTIEEALDYKKKEELIAEINETLKKLNISSLEECKAQAQSLIALEDESTHWLTR